MLTPAPAPPPPPDDPAGTKMMLVMEYMEGGPVLTRDGLEKREKVPEALALRYFRDCLKVCVWGGGEWGRGKAGMECGMCEGRPLTWVTNG